VSIDDSTFPKKQLMPSVSEEMAAMPEIQASAVQDMQLFTDVMQQEFQQ